MTINLELNLRDAPRLTWQEALRQWFGLTNNLLQSKLDLKVPIRICQIPVCSAEIYVNGSILLSANEILTRYLNMELMFHLSWLIDICRWEIIFRISKQTRLWPEEFSQNVKKLFVVYCEQGLNKRHFRNTFDFKLLRLSGENGVEGVGAWLRFVKVVVVLHVFSVLNFEYSKDINSFWLVFYG